MRYLDHLIEAFLYLLLLALSLSVTSLSGYLIHITGNVRILLPFTISSLLAAGSAILLYCGRLTAVIFGTEILTYIFHVVTGIVILEDVLQNGSQYSKNVITFYKVVTALFVLNSSLWAFALPKVTLAKHEPGKDLEKQNNDAYSSSGIEHEQMPNNILRPPNFFSHVQNKPSEQTLVDREMNLNDSEKTGDIRDEPLVFKVAYDDPNIDKQISDWFRTYKSEKAGAQKRKSTTSLDKENYKKKNQHHYKSSNTRRTGGLSNSKSMSFVSNKSFRKDNNTKDFAIEFDDSKNNELKNYNEDEMNVHVKRVKSTSYLASRRQHRRLRRWKSIQDEKFFLSNVDDSLLPPILKKNKEPIKNIKERKLRSPSQSTDYPGDKRRDSTDASTLGELKTRCSNMEDDDSDIPLGAFISEFDEPINQSYFTDFDQTSAVASVSENQECLPSDEKQNPSHDALEKKLSDYEVYLDTLNGLENIPRSISYLNIKEITPEKNSENNFGHISLNKWQKEADVWFANKNRIGLNLAIPGISRRIDNCGSLDLLQDTRTNGSESPHFGEHSISNIDEITDIDQNSAMDNDGPSNKNNRLSVGSPSLYTYRNISRSSNKSNTPLNDNSPSYNRSFTYPNAPQVKNSPPRDNTDADYYQSQNEHFSTPPVSPIKKFLQRSPKRLNDMLKRRGLKKSSASEVDLKMSPHLHKNSTGSSILKRNSLTFPTEERKSTLKQYFSPLSSPKRGPFPQLVPQKIPSPFYPDQNYLNMSDDSYSFGDLVIHPSSNQSRVSSAPSGVIGEYDKEKWRTLKDLGK